jgi:hypothetical protein
MAFRTARAERNKRLRRSAFSSQIPCGTPDLLPEAGIRQRVVHGCLGQRQHTQQKTAKIFKAIVYSVSAAICSSNQASSFFQLALSGESFTKRNIRS